MPVAWYRSYLEDRAFLGPDPCNTACPETLAELCQGLGRRGLRTVPSAVWRFFHRRGLTCQPASDWDAGSASGAY